MTYFRINPVLALLLLLPPLLAVIVDGVNRQLPEVLAQPVLWQALWTSLRIALAAGVLCVVLTMMLLWSSRELRARQKMLAGQVLEMSGMLILAMPGIVLATGFFLLLVSFHDHGSVSLHDPGRNFFVTLPCGILNHDTVFGLCGFSSGHSYAVIIIDFFNCNSSTLNIYRLVINSYTNLS